MNQLLWDIEKLRQEMCEVAKGKELADPSVVQISQRLDQLLNQYQHKSTHLN